MELFSLPHNSKVDRVIPKNAFDGYTTTKQKKLFTDLIARITWTHKISPDTVNLEAKDIKEIQIFWIELKGDQIEDVSKILEIIDKSIPYNILFIVELKGMHYISTSTKHPNPLKPDNCVIDWTFKTDWFILSNNKYTLTLRKNLDFVYQDFCKQLSNEANPELISFDELVEKSRSIDSLKKEIKKFKLAIDTSKQFNKKLELNMKLKDAEARLNQLMTDYSGNGR